MTALQGRALTGAAVFCATALAGLVLVILPAWEQLAGSLADRDAATARAAERALNAARLPALELEAARLKARRNGLAARHERIMAALNQGASLEMALAAVEEAAATGALELKEALAPEPEAKAAGGESAFWSAPLSLTVACDYRAAARLLQKLASSPAAVSIDGITLTGGGTGARPLVLTARMTMYGRRGDGL